MEDTHLHYTAAFASKSKKFPSLDAGVSYSGVAPLKVHTPPLSIPYPGSGGKRKCGAFDGCMKDMSLSLGLGHSSSSCTTLLSGKEVEQESSVSLGLSIDLHLGNSMAPNTRNASTEIPKEPEDKRHTLDLELSLSTGLAESDTTTVTQFSSAHQNSFDLPVITAVQLVDEGSTSSRWKSGPLVPPLLTMEISPPLDKLHSLPVTPSIPIAAVTLPKCSTGCTSGPENPSRRRNVSVKTCQIEGCTRGARGASGLCIAHGGGRRCQRAGCQKGAEGKTAFCKAHGGGRRCQSLGCTKSAEGRTEFCIGHGGGRRCNHEGCSRAARGKSGLCIRHGGGKRCKMENCTKSAEGISGLCISHGGGRRCQYPSCTKGAQGSTNFCKAHGGGKRCTFPGCTKGAEGSTAFCKGHGGGKRCTREGCTKSVHGGTLFCVSHGGGKRCAMTGCSKSARGRTNFCVRHGGGKRCKFEGCTKSAQGCTDFCKAHGGGKRCCWGELGSEFGDQATAPCDKFARGKSGLCAAHSAQVIDKQIQSSAPVTPALQVPQSFTFGFAATGLATHPHALTNPATPPQVNFLTHNAPVTQFSLPEGRVHGGGLMAMLIGGNTAGTSKANQVGNAPSEPGKGYLIPHSWV
nr:uncharacterized protein LOC109189101 [Ipomoea trifida]